MDDYYKENTIDLPDDQYSTMRAAFQLDGGQFGTVIENNDILHGDGPTFGSYVIQIPPGTPLGPPAPWGWYLAPAYDCTLTGNTFQDIGGPVLFESGIGGTLFPDFYLFQGTISNNTFLYDGATSLPSSLKVGGSYIPGSPATYSIAVTGNDVSEPAGQTTTIAYANTQGLTSPSSITLAPPPSAPANFAATADPNPGQIDLTWGSVVNASGYAIERSLNGTSGWEEIATSPGGATSYTDTLPTGAMTGYYRLRALTAAGYSLFTNTVQATTSANQPPGSFSAVSLGQDGTDFVGASPNSGPNGAQDIDIELTGLNTTLAIQTVDLTAPGIHFQFNAPFGSGTTDNDWRAELVRQGLSSVAHLYAQPGAVIDPGTQFTVTVTYSGGDSPQPVNFTGLNVANPSLPEIDFINTTTDTTTSGNRQAFYGADGYDMVNGADTLPAYATLSLTAGTAYTWNWATTDTRALTQPNSPNRLAAA